MDIQALRLRLTLLMLATVAGVVGVVLLYIAAAGSYNMDCSMDILAAVLPTFASLVSMAMCALLFLGADVVQRRYRVSIAAFVTIPLTLVVFFEVIIPCVNEQRALRHVEEMEERIPILNAIVSQIEASRTSLGHIPDDEPEFYEILGEDVWDDLRRRACCYGFDYTRLDAESYELRFTTLFLEYGYNSRTPDRGWYPIAAATQP